MTIGKLCCALVTTLFVTMTGCGNVQDPNQSQTDESPTNESETSQAVTGCELDCPNGPVLTCSDPCAVFGNNLFCSGGVTSCPSCVPSGCGGACGVVSDGCGGTLNCGTCPGGGGCPSGQFDCGDGECIPQGNQCP